MEMTDVAPQMTETETKLLKEASLISGYSPDEVLNKIADPRWNLGGGRWWECFVYDPFQRMWSVLSVEAKLVVFIAAQCLWEERDDRDY